MQVDSLLESIPRMFAESRGSEGCAGAAIHAAINVLAVRHVTQTLGHRLYWQQLPSSERAPWDPQPRSLLRSLVERRASQRVRLTEYLHR